MPQALVKSKNCETRILIIIEMVMNDFKYVRQRHLRKKTKRKFKGGTKYVWCPNRNVLLFETR